MSGTGGSCRPCVVVSGVDIDGSRVEPITIIKHSDTMRIFNSFGRVVLEGVGGRLGTFEPGWLEWRRGKILATRKKECATPCS